MLGRVSFNLRCLQGAILATSLMVGNAAIQPCRVLAENAGQGKMTIAMEDPMDVYRKSGINKGQEDKIRQLSDGFEKASTDKVSSLIALKREMRKLNLAPELDEKKLLSTQAQMNKLQGELSMQALEVSIKIRNVLTPEQKKKLVALIQQPKPSFKIKPSG